MIRTRRDLMKGHLGLLVRVRGAEPIPQLLDRRGEKGQEATGRLGVAWFGLLSIGTYLRARLDRRTTQEARLGRVRVAAGRHQAGAISVHEAHEAQPVRDRHPRRSRPGGRPPGLPRDRIRQIGYASSNGTGTPARHDVARDRHAIPAQLRFTVLLRDGFRCRYCGRTAAEPGVGLHVDHVVPLVAGGATSEDNLMTACSECNLGKSTRPVVSAGS
ncbi:MAG: HNH endonuclease signature motif containing protein [Candidatus Limnocylindrales bacterium]